MPFQINQNPKVSKWLSSLFGNKPVPVYEVNTRTTDILYELAECSESRCEDISLLIEDLKQKSTEYNVEGSYNHELLLEAVGLSSNILSKTALSCLNALEGTTVALSAKDTSLCSLMAAMDDLTNEVCATERKNQELDQQLTLLKKQMTAALVLHRSLQEDLGKTEDAQAVEMAKAENRLQNMDFLKAKSTDLIHRIRSCEKLTTLKQENTSLKKKLDSYMDLTPIDPHHHYHHQRTHILLSRLVGCSVNVVDSSSRIINNGATSSGVPRGQKAGQVSVPVDEDLAAPTPCLV
ncbi:HAUS1 protein, partial [Polypterus senegalus]|nr:HAUS1 protein [Polypterus senegalus]